MHHRNPSTPVPPVRWSTSAFGDPSASAPVELAALSEHLGMCRGSNSRLAQLQHAAQTLHGFVGPRFVTTLVLAALLIGGSLLVL